MGSSAFSASTPSSTCSAPAAAILVVPDLLVQTLGRPIGISDYAALAWLTSSLATAGGVLGAGLETDDAIREAAYSYHPSSTEA